MLTALVEQGMVKVGALLDLDPAEAHHLQVRRASSGDQIRLLDGRGGIGAGILSLGRKEARVEVVSAQQVPRPAALTLAVGAGDRERFTWLVEKAAELGVTDVLPLETERTVNVSSRIRPAHIDKLQARTLEAIKQSGTPWATTVHAPVPLVDALARKGEGRRLVAEMGGHPIPRLDASEPVTCFVGPEGGWSEEEMTRLQRAGCTFIGLSANILRFETAALALAVLIQQQRGHSTT